MCVCDGPPCCTVRGQGQLNKVHSILPTHAKAVSLGGSAAPSLVPVGKNGGDAGCVY